MGLLVLAVSQALATTVGTVTVAPEEKSLIVTAPYSGDTGTSNTLKIEWDLQGGSWSGASYGTITLPHAVSPYTHKITGLSNFTAYQVRVTCLDDTVSGTNPQTLTNLKPYNPRVHSSVTTNSGKWPDGWGVPSGQYGEFTCATCHAKNTGNIKRVRRTLNPGFPVDAGEVTFTDARGGATGVSFGDDTDRSVNRVCESCHSKNKYHNRELANNLSNTHNNNTDCISCHKHGRGFDADCTSCHGDAAAGNFWPDSAGVLDTTYADRIGSHQKHIDGIAPTIAARAGQDWATLTAAQKLGYQNATCLYCHPNPGGSNRDGQGHDINTNTSPDKVADLFNDGTYQPADGAFKDFHDGADDVDGLFNARIKRCSNVVCHSNGEFTWTWYPDVSAPGAIDDLAAGIADETGTVKLSWTAVGNDWNATDGDTGGIAYQYQMRYRKASDGTITAANWASSAVAGDPPTVLRTGKAQTMTVAGLQPGTGYYFAVKTTDDTMANWSPLSNVVNATAKTDTRAPVFHGLDSAKPAYASGAVDLAWGAAEDDTGPVTYLVYWCPANQSINYGSPSATTPGLTFQVTGLANGIDYKFAVRARDASPALNVDANTVVKEAIPQAPSEFDILGKMYYAIANSGTAIGGKSTNTNIACDNKLDWSSLAAPRERFSLLVTTGYVCGTTTKNEIQKITDSGNIITWVFNTAYAKPMNIHGGTFSLYLKEKSDSTGNNVWFDLGYWNPGTGAFITLASEYKIIGKKARGVVKAYFIPAAGDVYKIPAGMKLAVRLRKETTKELEIRFASKKGPSVLNVYEQEDNNLPGAFTVTTPASPAAGIINLNWTAAADPDGPAPVYYDVYGSIDNGASYPFIIAEGLTTTSTTWDTVKEGIGLSAAQNNVKIRVGASDGMMHRTGVGVFEDHRYVASNAFTINNSIDTTVPATITDLRAEHRPKGGTVWLYWTAPGDDGTTGKASQYDIRYALSDPDNPANVIDAEAKWTAATQALGEPVPGEPGHTQGYEMLGLNPGKNYYFAIRAGDETTLGGSYPTGNWSALSNSPKSEAGLRCGVCHSTPPDEPNRAGTHDEHGYTQTDCAKCHGNTADFNTLNHTDGVIKMAWNNPKKGFFNTAAGPVSLTSSSVRYDSSGYKIYEDANGPGGFNDLSAGAVNVDNGRCFNFNPQAGYSGVTGCHGPGQPVWGDRASVTCAMCHGSMSRATTDPYSRAWEDQTIDSKYSGSVKIYKSAPGVDLLGNLYSNAVGQHERHLNFSYRLTGDSCALCHKGMEHADGTVDVLMDVTVAGAGAQWTPGAPGTCTGTSELRCHGNNATPPPWRTRDVEPNGTKIINCNECHGHQDNNFWPGTTAPVTEHTATVSANLTGNGSTTTVSVESAGNTMVVGDRIIRGSTYFVVTAKTATSLTFHKAVPVGINFGTGEVLVTKHIPHTFDAGQVRPCTWCHVEGHPQGDETTAGTNPPGQETVFIPNNAPSGLNYTSGGIHLRKNINGRGAKNTEAEICWTCHDANGISEWGANTDANTGNSPYNYGQLYTTSGLTTTTSNWVDAWWKSANFAYKTAQVKSTHSVNPAVARPGADSVAQIRCSYCHDVHDMNHAPGDAMNGKPLLRGSWMGNPYQEDGAPGRTAGWSGLSTYDKANYYYDGAMDDFGLVPRGSVAMSKLGGYWIDQNSDYPAASWTLQNSAGLCVLCHGNDVNNMNKFNVKEDGVTADNAWIGTNGHSNAVLGGTGTNKYNVYDTALRKEGTTNLQPGMGYQNTTQTNTDGWYGLRNNMGNSDGRLTSGTPYATDNNMGVYPYAWSTTENKNRYAVNEFGWGVNADDTAAEPMYHRFSCSKCHNPHASRLPRLMITNCLDVSHNKWDDTFVGDADWTSGRYKNSSKNDTDVNWSTQGVMPYTGNDVSGTARNKQFAYATSAQNCHRYVNVNNDSTPEEPGWNKVTPWAEDATNYAK